MLKTGFGTIVTATFLSTTLFAQDAGRAPATEQGIRDKFVNEDRAAARKSISPKPAPIKGRNPTKQIERFSVAVETYRAALTSDAALEKPLKEMEQSIGDLEKWFKTPGTPKVKKAEFAGLSRPELAAETLKSADRIKADTGGLSKIAEDPVLLFTQDARTYLGDLHRETLRLKFLISKTRSSR